MPGNSGHLFTVREVVLTDANNVRGFLGRPMTGQDTVPGFADAGESWSVHMGLFGLFESSPFNDLVYARGGDDWIFGGQGQDTLLGEEGNDALGGGEEADFLMGGVGDDTLWGAGDADTLFGADGHDSIVGDDPGDAAADSISGGEGSDTVWGGGGNDLLWGDTGGDLVHAGAGKDTVYGGEGDDWLIDDAEGALVFGEGGNDLLQGGEVGDYLRGDRGSDTLAGGAGNDFLDGTTGGGPADFVDRDVFAFAPGGGHDTVYGLHVSLDRVDLTAYAGTIDSIADFDGDGDGLLGGPNDHMRLVSFPIFGLTPNILLDLGAAAGGPAGVDTVVISTPALLGEGDFIFGSLG